MTTWEQSFEVRVTTHDLAAAARVSADVVQLAVARTVLPLEGDQVILVHAEVLHPLSEVTDDPRPTSDDPPEG